jgi:hypothetical protein
MKIKFELDGEPQELREFFGVPNPEQIGKAFTNNFNLYSEARKSFYDNFFGTQNKVDDNEL